MNSEYYDLLGLSKNCNQKDIKTAYKKKAIKTHPDKGGDPEEFKKISEAYSVLSDVKKRDMYDKFGKNGPESFGGSNFNPTDIFKNIFGNNMFGGNTFFSFGGNQHQKAKDIIHVQEVDIETVYRGGSVTATIKRENLCHTCKGKGSNDGKDHVCTSCRGKGVRVSLRQLAPGMMQQIKGICGDCGGTGERILPSEQCNTCDGNKKLIQDHTLMFNIPKGVIDKMVIKNQGNELNGVRSSVIVKFTNKPHNIFTVNKNNLVMTMKISLYESMCGFKKNIKFINGEKLVFISEPGEVLKDTTSKIIKGKGMPIYNKKGKYGDLVINFEIKYPTKKFILSNMRELERFFD